MDLFYRFDFAAARRLPFLPAAHPCSRLHGHTFNVELNLRGEPDPSTGWFVDFDEIEQLTRELKAAIDHQYLNEIAGLELPTTEMIAQWLWQRLAARISGLHCVIVQEHPSRGVRYFGPGTS